MASQRAASMMEEHLAPIMINEESEFSERALSTSLSHTKTNSVAMPGLEASVSNRSKTALVEGLEVSSHQTQRGADQSNVSSKKLLPKLKIHVENKPKQPV